MPRSWLFALNAKWRFRGSFGTASTVSAWPTNRVHDNRCPRQKIQGETAPTSMESLHVSPPSQRPTTLQTAFAHPSFTLTRCWRDGSSFSSLIARRHVGTAARKIPLQVAPEMIDASKGAVRGCRMRPGGPLGGMDARGVIRWIVGAVRSRSTSQRTTPRWRYPGPTPHHAQNR